MDLRKKTLIVICVIFVSIVAGFILYSSVVLQKSYADIEKQKIENDLGRADYAIGSELGDLDSRLRDWAIWDDTYDFVNGNNSNYIERNLQLDTFLTLDLDFLLIYNQSSGLVYAKAYNRSLESFEPVDNSLLEVVRVDNLLNSFESPDMNSSLPGVLSDGDHDALVSVRPILRSNGEGPVVGSMIMGRNLDQERLDSLSKSTGMTIDLLNPAEVAADESFASRSGQTIPENPSAVILENGSVIRGLSEHKDITGQQNYFIEIIEPRTIFQSGLSTINSFLAIVILLGLLVGTLGIAGLDRFILRRISRITTDIEKVKRGDSSSRITEVPGNDELTRLSQAINRMLEDLSFAHERVMESELRYRSVVEDQTEYICRFKPDGAITFMNPAFIRRFIHPDDGSDSHPINTQNPAWIWQEFQNSIGTLTPQSPIGTSEKKYSLAGEDFWTAWTIRSIFNQENVPQEYQCVGRNITAETKARNELQQYKVHLEDLVKERTDSLLEAQKELQKIERLEAIGILAAGIAHDFNNLLLTIIGNIELLEEQIGKDSPFHSRLQELKNATLRASSLTHQMLTFSKGGAPIMKLTNIVDIVRQTAEFACRGSNVRCNFSLAKDIFEVSADADQISQVVTNIILNAISAMPGGGAVEVSLKNSLLGEGESPPLEAGPYVTIEIVDRGSGIPPELLDRIFEPFFSTKKGGTGLGLASSYSIIRKHGGHIYVSSEVGKGSRFTIYLPAAGKHAEEPPTAINEAVQETVYNSSGRRILIMDDEEAIREVLMQMFQMKGFDVAAASDGTEAIRIYRDAWNAGQRFDIVIMDLTIPGGLGGKETIKILSQFDPGVKAIVSSGYFDDPVMSDYENFGFKGVLPKPYVFKALYALVNRIMEEK